MLDWFILFDNLMFWLQTLVTYSILGLFLIAGIGFFISKKTMIECILAAVAVLTVALAFEQFGIQLLTDEVVAFFNNFIG